MNNIYKKVMHLESTLPYEGEFENLLLTFVFSVPTKALFPLYHLRFILRLNDAKPRKCVLRSIIQRVRVVMRNHS